MALYGNLLYSKSYNEPIYEAKKRRRRPLEGNARENRAGSILATPYVIGLYMVRGYIVAARDYIVRGYIARGYGVKRCTVRGYTAKD